MVSIATQLSENGQLCGKVAGSIMDRIALIGTETGHQAAYWKASIQFEDDSVLELRVRPCPDGCGSVSTVVEAIPELSSLA